MQLSNEELGRYLENARKIKGYSTYDVNKLTEISQSYISLIERGKRKASAVILKTLAPVYGLNYLDLYEKAGYLDLIEDEKLKYKIDELGNPVTEVPILGTVKAGYDYLAQENWIGTIDISKKLAETGEFFALKIHGDSMFPTFIENDIVIVRKQSDFENGDIVVALINGEEATVKKGKKSESNILLQPLNTNYEPLIFTNEEMKTIPVKIIGVVKQLKREF